MSTPDERHYLRLFHENPQMQEGFIVRLLSMRAFHELEEGEASPTVKAIDVVIGAFVKKFSDWETEQSVAHGGVQYIRERNES